MLDEGDRKAHTSCTRPFASISFRAISGPKTSRDLEETQMRKLIVVSLALTLVMSVVAFAQNATDTAKDSDKAVNVSGKISDDGKTFVTDDGKTLTVSNPEAVKGHEGHQVTLSAHVYPDKNEVHVMSVTMGKVDKTEMQKDNSQK